MESILIMSAPSTTVPASTTACWSCAAASGSGHFCAACGKIQPLPRGADFFVFFGLPRKLALDLADLEKRFHSLSWKLHPDNFMRATEFERQLSLERSSQLNDAYRTLRDPVARVEYLLGLSGMRKEGQQKQQAPPELLEEVFELNESLDELREAKASGGNAAEMEACERSSRRRRASSNPRWRTSTGNSRAFRRNGIAPLTRPMPQAPDRKMRR